MELSRIGGAFNMGNAKFDRKSYRVKTHLSDAVLAKTRNIGTLESGLPMGSKHRLRLYQDNLSVSRGIEKPLFDDKVADLLRHYVWSPEFLNSVLDYLNGLRDPKGYLFSRDLKIYSECSDAIFRFTEDDYSSFRWNKNYQQSLKTWRDFFGSIKKHPLKYQNDDDMREALPKEDTHSGFTWVMTGLKYKGENMEGIYKNYVREERKALEEGSFNKPILIGFRTQASGEFEDDGSETGTCKHKLRVVSMIDLIQIMAELKFAKPCQELLGHSNYYAGGKNETDISIILNHWRTRWKKFISIDYSSFDQTISSWLIEDAFDVISEMFIMNDEEKQLYEVIKHDFIHKCFITNEGLVYSHKGVPSGSMFTQIIDSVVNLVVVSTYFNSINARCNMMAMGDDNIIFCDDFVEMDKIATYISKNFGLVVKVDDKSNEGSTKESPKFLSRYWTHSGQWRHPKLLVSRLLFPERRRDYTGEVGPEHVLYAFILTYGKGMGELMDVARFQKDYSSLTRKMILDKVDSRYLPGALAYIREYT